MANSTMDEKFVQYFNEALAMENAAVERIRARINETPVEQTRQQLQYHMEQTLEQQDRLKNIISKMGGSPTAMKAVLPLMMPANLDTTSNTVKEAAKSQVSSVSKDTMDAERELIQTKQDAIIENAEIVSYKTLILMAQEAGMQEVISELNKSLHEETAMVNFIMGNTPTVLRLLMPQLQALKAKKSAKKEEELIQPSS